MNSNRKTVIADYRQTVHPDYYDAACRFIRIAKYFDALYALDAAGEFPKTLENAVFGRALAMLQDAGGGLPSEARVGWEEQARVAGGGQIYDLLALTAADRLDFILGKVFSSEKINQSRYGAASGVVNRAFEGVISQYDAKLDFFLENLPAPAEMRGVSIRDIAPVMRCVDVFALAGELSLRHKPICVFFSGGGSERLSTLSRMTVFLNVYTERFRLISKEIARKYIAESPLIETLGCEDAARILILWLRGHDLGHFWGVDALSPKMQEFDGDYFSLHELKSDALSLYNLRFLAEDLLPGEMLRAAYVASVAEMFRYIRCAEGDFFARPDTASALLAYRYLTDAEGINYDSESGKFSLDFQRFELAVERLSGELLRIFAEGGVEGARAFVRRYSMADQSDVGFRRVMEDAEIPHYVDFNFEINRNKVDV